MRKRQRKKNVKRLLRRMKEDPIIFCKEMFSAPKWLLKILQEDILSLIGQSPRWGFNNSVLTKRKDIYNDGILTSQHYSNRIYDDVINQQTRKILGDSNEQTNPDK